MSNDHIMSEQTGDPGRQTESGSSFTDVVHRRLLELLAAQNDASAKQALERSQLAFSAIYEGIDDNMLDLIVALPDAECFVDDAIRSVISDAVGSLHWSSVVPPELVFGGCLFKLTVPVDDRAVGAHNQGAWIKRRAPATDRRVPGVKFASEPERDFALALVDAGCAVVPASLLEYKNARNEYVVDEIDCVAVKGGRVAVIETDGRKHHSGEVMASLDAEQVRELRRLFRFHVAERFPAWEVGKNPSGFAKQVLDMLEP